jgi:hypothetical protein
MQDQRTSDIRLCQAFSPVKPELSGACTRFLWRALEPPAGVRGSRGLEIVCEHGQVVFNRGRMGDWLWTFLQ